MGALRFRRSIALVVALVLLLSGHPQPADAATCSATQLVPNLTRFEVNQGLGSYERLTRGKDTIVRAYFSLPDPATCTLGSNQALNITAATLTAAVGSSASGTIAAANTAGLGTSPALSAPPALVNSAHDPLFVVQGSVLPGLAPSTASFTATFTVNVTYTRKVSRTETTSGLTQTYSTTKVYEQQSKAIRILYQPLGDTSASTIQFTDADRTSVINGAQTLLRTLPVPAGPLGSLRPTGRSGGVRYEIAPSLLNVANITGAYPQPLNKFCPKQSVFVALAPTLGATLDAFNSVQAAEDAADFIVGVYGEGISGGSADGCALGMATANGKVSIARAVADKPKAGSTPAQVSQTGGVMTQELAHNVGVQPSPRSATFHSSFIQADSTDPEGAYNLAAVTYIAGDKTALNVNTSTGPWDNNVTVLEQPDYAFMLCRFGGATLPGAECTNADPGGTLVGVAAIDSYLAAGDTTNGVTNAYFGTSAGTAAAPNSLIRLLQLRAGLLLTNTGVPASFTTTHGDLSVQPGVFAFALPGTLASGVDETRIVKLTAPTDNPLLAPIIFQAFKNPAAPAVTSLTASENLVFPGGTVNLTKSVTPPRNPDGDIVFLADTTGSMQPAIDDVRNSAADIMSQIRAEQSESWFGVASYKDFNDPPGCVPSSSYVYNLEQAVTSDTETAQFAMGAWTADGGCDEPEAQLYALHQVATSTDPATGFRTDPVRPRVIGWFGDAPGHDPSPAGGITEAAAISALQGAGIRVVAAPFTTPGNSGLDATGQATRIANATGGAVKPATSPDLVAEALLAGLFSATVEPRWTCDEGLSLAVDPARRVVRSGTEAARFDETVTVAGGTPPGDYSCTVDFYVNGKQVMAGGSPDPAFQQVITVGVGGTTAVAEGTSYNGDDAVADFIYHCPGTPFFPVATSVGPSSITTDPSGLSTLSFSALIDASVVPGGDCTLTTLISDLFERSSPTDPDATTTVKAVTKAPVVEIYTPGDGELFSTKAKVFATGWGTDPDGGPLTFAWTITGPSPSTTVVASGSGPNQTFGPFSATGVYTVTFRGTDVETRTGTATRTFNVVADSQLPQLYSFTGFFPPAKNWPQTNQVNGGQAFTPRWILRDSSGQDVTTNDAIFGAQLQQVDCSTRAPIGPPVFNWQVGATMIRYDTKGGQWVANVNIPAGVGKCYTWTLQLKDGSLHPLFLQVVK